MKNKISDVILAGMRRNLGSMGARTVSTMSSGSRRMKKRGVMSVSLYNMMHGFNPSCIFFLPMLGRKPDEYPRFRDCFLEDGKIAIYTRVGGNNRNCGYGEEELYKDPNYVSTYDDEFDPTYATYLFNVPEKWKADFDLIMANKFSEVSDEYYQQVCEFYPKLAANGEIDLWFYGSDLTRCSRPHEDTKRG